MTWPIDDLIMTGFDQGTDFPESSGGRTQLLAAINKLKAIIAQLNVADGVCGLNAQTKVDLARILRSAANGIAELDTQARLPLSALILNVANGLLASNASNRCALANSSLVLLSTPELITSAPAVLNWTTVSNATLSGAGARFAILRAVCFTNSAANGYYGMSHHILVAPAGQYSGSIYPADLSQNFVADGNYVKTGSYAAYAYDVGTTIVELDALHRFAYLYNGPGDPNATFNCSLYLVGYIK